MVEREPVASLEGRYSGLDGRGSAFYLAAWSAEAPSAIEARLGRSIDTAVAVIRPVP